MCFSLIPAGAEDFAVHSRLFVLGANCGHSCGVRMARRMGAHRHLPISGKRSVVSVGQSGKCPNYHYHINHTIVE